MLFKISDNKKHIKRYPFVPKMKLHLHGINGIHVAGVMATLVTLEVYRSREIKWCLTRNPNPKNYNRLLQTYLDKLYLQLETTMYLSFQVRNRKIKYIEMQLL